VHLAVLQPGLGVSCCRWPVQGPRGSPLTCPLQRNEKEEKRREKLITAFLL
jgi:hypothetical protein